MSHDRKGNKINDSLKSITLQKLTKVELILVVLKRIIKILHSSGPPHSNLDHLILILATSSLIWATSFYSGPPHSNLDHLIPIWATSL